MTSIAKRIISSFVTCSTGVLLGVTAAAFTSAQRDGEAAFDLELRTLVLSADAVLAPNSAAPAWQAADHLTLQEWSAPGTPLHCLGDDCHLAAPARAGYGVVTAEDGHHVRVYALTRNGRLLQASQPLRSRWLLAGRAAALVAVPGALAIALVALLLGAVTWRAFAPARRFVADLDTRGETFEPPSADPLPQELRGLARSFTGWAGRISTDRDRQRRFTRDAAELLGRLLTTAHEHAEAAAASVDVTDRAAKSATLLRTLGRAQHLVDQARTLTSVEDRVLPPSDPMLRLDDLARAEVMAQAPAAHARRIAVSLDARAPVQLRADGEALRQVLHHILDNAIRYTPAPGRVRVAVESRGDDAALIVDDTGTGIAELERDRVFEPFYRAPGTLGSGSGLGLSIARHIVLQHRGSISLGSAPEGGLRVEVVLPSDRRLAPR